MAVISTLTGDFSNAVWTKGTNHVANATDPTRFEMTITAGAGFTTSTNGWTLTASSLSWKNQHIPPYVVTNSGSPASSQLSLEIRDGGTASTGYRLLRSGTTGAWQFQKSGTIVGATWTDLTMRANPYNRLRESGGTTFFEFSPDGSSWSQPNGAMSTANYATLTNLGLRWQPGTTADGGMWVIQELNQIGTSPTITEPTIYFMQQTGSSATAVVNASPTAPTVSTGDLSILIVSGKLTTGATATSTTPSGWTIIGAISQSGTAATNAADGGDTAVVMYQRQDSGYGAPTISTTGFDSMSSNIVVFRSSKVTAGGTWNVSGTTTGSDTTSGANISITGGADISAAAGDVVLAAVGVSGDVFVSGAAYALGGMSGATIGTAPDVPLSVAVTTNNDSRQIALFTDVIGGTSSTAPTYAHTTTSSTTAHSRFLRIRDVAVVAPASFIFKRDTAKGLILRPRHRRFG